MLSKSTTDKTVLRSLVPITSDLTRDFPNCHGAARRVPDEKDRHWGWRAPLDRVDMAVPQERIGNSNLPGAASGVPYEPSTILTGTSSRWILRSKLASKSSAGVGAVPFTVACMMIPAQ